MSSQKIESHRENAEVYTDAAVCKQKSLELLEKMNLPRGLLPLDDIVEVGYNEGSGFVWLRQKKSKTHVFRSINRSVWYDTEVTAFVEDRRMKRLTGVKSKELLIWITICDISIQDPSSGKITFGTPTGLSRSFPVKAFEEEEEEKGKK
ncbi:hypothetical protein BUALT_Bualt03G0026400 [Buddleja alternifolia]|uniref:DUF538 domain-containing protein n=1 Tax=Buddleja alternifolia TaxID=168488 RepID=A0AAV6XST9_9LAMI|nr:hypothetical protein BUALT_Bualt03G0026400 [Buddleja alternifolia]